MAGEVNPADLFTKHLPSREKIHQLTKLFGVEYRSGRASTAPLLRPHSNPEREGGHPPTGDALPAFGIREAMPHDCSKLPHQYDPEDIEKLFPLIPAAPEIANNRDWIPGEENCWGVSAAESIDEDELRGRRKCDRLVASDLCVKNFV